MTRRRLLGTGPSRTDLPPGLPPVPRALLAAERIPSTPTTAPADPRPAQPAARRTLGAGPSSDTQPPPA